MDFKKGNWNVGDSFDLEKAAEMMDEKMAKNIMGNLRKQLGPEGFPKPSGIKDYGLQNSEYQPPRRDYKQRDLPPASGYKMSQLGKQGSKPDLVSQKMASPARAKYGIGGAPVSSRSGARSGSKGRASASGDSDLLTSMTKRLAQLEGLNQALRLEVKEKHLKLNTLTLENEKLRLASDKNSVKEVSEIIQERDKYRMRCQQMEKFLSDYGLKWIGDDADDNTSGASKQHEGKLNTKAINQELAHKAPMYRNNLPKEIDTEVLTRRIEELNFIAEKERIVSNAYGMKEFKKLEPVQIFFFKNGIIIKGLQFSPYYAKEAQSILSDILDGYFPYDLKKAYPEGVPLEPVDCTDETYTADLAKNHSNPKFKMFSDLQKDGAKPMSKEQFLKQFPKNVIDKGNVVPIREELEKKFKETGKIDVSKLNSNEPIEAPTDVALAPEKYDSASVVTLRIRTETGKRTIIVKLLRTDKMDLLYDYVNPYVEFSDKAFELRSKFPNKAFAENEAKNLEELGLAPSSALVVHTK